MCMTKQKIVIFGTGKRSGIVTKHVDFSKVEIVAYADNHPDRWGGYFNAIKIIHPTQLGDYEYDMIVIASYAFDVIYEQLLDYGISRDKIISIYKDKCYGYTQEFLDFIGKLPDNGR